jgi:TPR repeat protein
MNPRLSLVLVLFCWLLFAAPLAAAVEGADTPSELAQEAVVAETTAPVEGSAPAAADASTPPATFGVPGLVDPAELWKDFLGRGSAETIAAMVEVMERIEGEAGEPSVETCTAEAASLRDLAARLPVSIALWHLAYECAELRGDEAEADAGLDAVAALSRHALALNPSAYSGAPPIRIMHEADATVMLEAMGLEIAYAYFDPISDGRFLRLHLGASDPADGSERQFQFDFIDVWMQLQRDEPNTEFPAFRSSLVQSYLSQSAQAYPGSIAEQALRVLEALGEDDEEAQRAQLVAAASQGNLLAGLSLAERCMRPYARGCGGSAIDALLPLAEREFTPALLDLSIAYDLGKGIHANPTSAATLLKRVEARIGETEALLTAGRRSLRLTDLTALSRPLRQRLGALARAGSTEAQMLLTTSKFSGYLSVLKPKEESALLADPGTWYMSLHRQAERLDGFGQHPDRALALHRAAAERGGAEGVIGLARHMARSERLRRQESEFEAALKAAGHAGDPGSMAALAERLDARGEKRRALGWFVSAQQRGSLYGAMGVARAMARGETGTEEAPRKAIELLRLLAEAEFVPARLELALLLTDGVEGVAPAPEEAARLLMSNVRMDHAPSIRELADAVLFERLPVPRGFKAEKALRDLAEDGDAHAKYLLGMAIRGERTPQARAEEALQLLQEAADAGVMDARNDLAWISCTSERAEYFEPVRGLQVARRMAMEPHLSASNKDTLAACHAANGEFEQAIALMREVLAPEASHSGEQRALYADRLQRFERGEAFRESR